MNLKLCEPLRLLFKDEVRRVGTKVEYDAPFDKSSTFPRAGFSCSVFLKAINS